MKAKSLIILAVTGLMAASITAALAAQPPKMKMTTDIPASITEPWIEGKWRPGDVELIE
jgi:hypothetical protein